jgi:hypothetical protein
MLALPIRRAEGRLKAVRLMRSGQPVLGARLFSVSSAG